MDGTCSRSTIAGLVSTLMRSPRRPARGETRAEDAARRPPGAIGRNASAECAARTNTDRNSLAILKSDEFSPFPAFLVLLYRNQFRPPP